MHMEKLYKALTWLASVALVCGLVVAFMVQASPSFPGLTLSGARGFAPTFFSALTGNWFMELSLMSTMLTDGAIVLGATVAWMGHRRAWLVALLVVTVLTLIWPAAVQAWQVATFVPQAVTGGSSPQSISTINFMLFAVPLIPVVMALVMTLTHRRLTPPSATTSTDAELGIVRSSL